MMKGDRSQAEEVRGRGGEEDRRTEKEISPHVVSRPKYTLSPNYQVR